MTTHSGKRTHAERAEARQERIDRRETRRKYRRREQHYLAFSQLHVILSSLEDINP
jgi:hypothetical protein